MLADIPTESLAELLAQVYPRQAAPDGLHILSSSLGRGSVVEIQGGPSSGKTHLLFYLIIDCIIPSQHAGWAEIAIVLDMDHSFDIKRLSYLLRRRLMRSASLDPSAVESTARQSLQRLHIFRPSSTLQLAATVSHLATYHSSQFSRDKIGVVAIDSVSSRYWPDRFVAEQINYLTSPMETGSKHVPPFQRVLLGLESFSRTHRPLVVMTNWGLYSIKNSVPSLYRQHLQPFPTLPSLRSIHPDRGVGSVGMISSENLPNLTWHITLQNIDTSTRCSSSTGGEPMRFSLSLRKANSSSVGNFILSISDRDISILDTT